jgi:hypothetical protein
LALASFDGANDLALSSGGATVESATGTGGHGNATATIDGLEQSGAATWTRFGVGVEIVIDLGGTFDVNRVRAHQRNDGCCQDRLVDFTISLLADDGAGNPGAVVASGTHSGQPANSSSGDVILSPLVGRFIRIQNNDGTNRTLSIGEIEAFSSNVAPLALASLDGTNDHALSSDGATVESATVGGGHGVATATIDGNEQTGGATWTVTAVGAQITIDLGGTFDVNRVRAHQRNDGCCQDRLRDYTVTLLADDGTGNPGAVVASGRHAGQAVTNSSGEVVLTKAPVGRYLRVKNNGGANRPLHIGEIEAFSGGVTTASFDGTSDLALASGGATVESATGSLGHGSDAATIDGSEQTGGATWTRNGVDVEIVIDLGSAFDVDRVRVHQRNDGCCQDRLNNFTVSLLADDGTGNPGAVVQSAIFAGQAASNSFGQVTLAPIEVSLSDTAILTVTIDGVSPPATVFRFR